VINFISNLPKDLRSGGFSAMNVAAFSAISRSISTRYIGPVNPPVVTAQKVWSKLKRVMGRQGTFHFFSERRLLDIAREVRLKCQDDAALDFFHGFTPWILTKSERPYYAWSDCTFRDCVTIFHHREQFCAKDLDRIEQAEAQWLRKASRVLFTSDWAAERAVRDYSLDARRVGVVGIFGEVEMAPNDAYAGGREFAFVSTNFESKGGRIVLPAFRIVRRRYPDALLTIVGDRPRHHREPGIMCTGFLRKEVPSEYRLFQEILGRVRGLVSPTSADICPLLLIEAGYMGCPVISTRRFAIPEIIEDGRTGLLLDELSPHSVANAICRMIEQTSEYTKMRKAAWEKVRVGYSRARFDARVCSYLNEIASGDRLL
jgi:glycosyltransferase involved in cell wall biosynthesis